jgi:hypothetical protein
MPKKEKPEFGIPLDSLVKIRRTVKKKVLETHRGELESAPDQKARQEIKKRMARERETALNARIKRILRKKNSSS